MRKMLKVGSAGLLCAAVTALLFSAAPQKAEARPPFLGIFGKQYDTLTEQVKEVKCAVCHPAEDNKDKKKRNAYGIALEKAIGKKNEKDKEKVLEAMVKVEKEKSGYKEMTFGDLIKAGKLPGSVSAAE